MADPDGFDRPLARAARPDGHVATAACLDAATLAAWTEGTLRPAERAAAEAHAADCERCLALLAAMAKTEPPPAVPARTAWWPMRWLVPLATAAVAMAAWMIVRDPTMVPPPALQEIGSAPAPPASSAVAPPSEAAKQDPPEARREQDQRSAARRRDPQPTTPETKAPASAPAAAVADSVAAPSFKAEASSENLVRRQAQALTPAPVVPSPDPTVLWRLSGRSIEQTRDGGRTWSTQATAAADLVAGVSPAPGTCWIVGRSGLVLRSSDGETWQTTASPAPGIDLVAVTATSALSAAITTVGGSIYRTADGGRTWTLQEPPAAPF